MRTPNRIERVSKAIEKRQPGLTVVLENVEDPHNIMAVLRTCDAAGVLNVHIVESVVRRFNLEIGRRSSSSAKKWVNVVQHHSVDECYTMLRKEGKTIMATAFTKKAKDLYQLDLASNCALVFGNEKYGLTEEAIQKAEITFTIPQHGMIKSLNISVACAICLYESVRQRDKAGLYNTPQLNTTEIDYLRNNWLKLE